MGTRAAFWIGDPRTAKREWLGCIAWDGHPENFPGLKRVESAAGFRRWVTRNVSERDDFAPPSGGWPFPWPDDIFLTDVTFAFFNGAVRCTWGHGGFRRIDVMLGYRDTSAYFNRRSGFDELSNKVHCGRDYDPSQPDSIMVVRVRPHPLGAA